MADNCPLLLRIYCIGLMLAMLAGMTGCGTDSIELAVSAVYPAPGATNVPLNLVLRGAFNKSIQQSTLDSNTFSIDGVVGATRTTTQSASLIPSSPSQLQPNTVYTVTLKGGDNGIKDLNGNALPNDYTWSFTTTPDPTYITGYPCDNFYTAGFTLVSGMDAATKPVLAKPAKGIPFADPTYNTCIVRVTDAASEPPDTFARNDYSRRQAFNADDTLVLVYSVDGGWHVYDARTMEHIKKLVGVGGEPEPQWHPTNPDLIYSLPSFGGMEIRETNVKTDVQQKVADFTQPDSNGLKVTDIWPTAARLWTGSEGSPSVDGRYWGFLVQDASYNYLGLMSYDMQTNTITGTFSNAAGYEADDPNNVSMSPSGDYIVAQFGSTDRPLGPGPNGGPIAFTRDFSTYLYIRPNGVIGHNDVAIDATGDDVFVGGDHNSGHLFMTNLRTGVSTNLFYFWQDCSFYANHISGKAFNKPGWVVVSSFASPGCWANDKVFVVELSANPRILHLAHHHTVFGPSSFSYFSQPHASPNRDLTRIVFNSNWDTADTDNDWRHVDTYMIQIPPDAIP